MGMIVSVTSKLISEFRQSLHLLLCYHYHAFFFFKADIVDIMGKSCDYSQCSVFIFLSHLVPQLTVISDGCRIAMEGHVIVWCSCILRPVLML